MSNKPENKPKNVILTVLSATALVAGVIAFYAGLYLAIDFKGQTAAELFFYLLTNEGNQGGDLALIGVMKTCIPCILTVGILLFVIFSKKGNRIKIGRIQFFPVKHKKTVAALCGLIFLILALSLIGFFEYVAGDIFTSDFIEANYIVPEGKVTAEEKKRNLIFIEIESLETTLFTAEQGGGWSYEVIPEFHSLLNDYDAVYFATDGNVRGTPAVSTTTWTTGALVSYTSGLPFKIPFSARNSFKSDHFMQGAYSLGDTLQSLGYRNVLFSGAMTSFGGVGDYFTNHGKYEIIDIDSYSGYGFEFPHSQENEWGISDEALFGMVRHYLEEYDFSVPLNLLVSTIDTHISCYTYRSGNGFEGSERKFGRNIENAYATTSRVVGKFISWLKSTDFYKNTTVVIVGDHNNMLADFYRGNNDIRGRYNVILNSTVYPKKEPHNRIFSPMDFYPTVLSAMGMKIDGDRLGLGVDLFSDKSTLAEIYGLKSLNRKIDRKSVFYNKAILGDDAEMFKKLAESEANRQ